MKHSVKFSTLAAFHFNTIALSALLALTASGLQPKSPSPFRAPMGPLLGVHGSIDLLAARPDSQDDMPVCFVVECKRANEKIRNWLLLPNRQQRPRWPTFIFSDTPTGERERLGVTRGITFPGLGLTKPGDFTYCINGVEVNTALTNTNKDPSEKIYNPLKQVVHGSVAFETTYPKVVEGVDYFRDAEHSRRVFIPVILTTVNIYVANFSPERVVQGDMQAGDLSVGAPLEWATFELALPDYLSYSVQRGEHTTAVQKLTVFIVNDKALDKFFTNAVQVQGIDTIPER